MLTTKFNPDPPYSEEEIESIRACCSLLLSCWSVVRGKDKESKKMWDTINNSRYRTRIEENLNEVGLQLNIVDSSGQEVAFLTGDYPQMRVRFGKPESIVLLRMYQILRNNNNKISLLKTGCMVDVKDLLSAVLAHQKTKITESELKGILYKLERFNLCKVEEKNKKNFSLNTQIRIFPSVSALGGNKTVGWELEILNQYKKECGEHAETDIDLDEEETEDGN